MMRMKHIYILLLLGITLMLSSCYHRHNSHQQHAALIEYSNKQLDSISFSTTHHYTNKFNFMVFKDSLILVKQLPEELMSELQVDSFAVEKGRLLVVTDIRMVPQDSIDSVWVQLATEDNTFGWTRESKMLQQVVPDDPISEFIMNGYLYNIANKSAHEFYKLHGMSHTENAFELSKTSFQGTKTGESLIMQCRHCIRYSLGYCVKRGGKKPTWKEPLYLELGDGRRFRLEFACNVCQMNIYSD